MKHLPLLFLLAGFVGLALLISNIGLPVLFANLLQLGWCLLIIVGIELLVDVFNTKGWWYTFSPRDRMVPFGVLYAIRQAGAAINAVTPTATIGGEFVKVSLLQSYLPIPAGIVSVITAKLSLAFGQAFFVTIGLIVFLQRLHVSSPIAFALVGTFVLTLLGCVLFLRFQRTGLFASGFRLAEWLRISPAIFFSLRDKTELLDMKLAAFHAAHSMDFALSVLFHFLAQWFGALQIYLLLRWLEIPADIWTCCAIEALALLIDGALFFVPGKVGVQEGGKVLIFTALGYTAATGLTVGVALRLNQIIVTILGLLMLTMLQTTSASRRSARHDRRTVLHEPQR